VTFESLIVPAISLISITTLFLLLSVDWRLSIICLALQYVGVFLIVALSWPLSLAVVKLVAGWMAGAVLGMALIGAPGNNSLESGINLANILFRIMAALLIGLIVLSLAPKVTIWIPGIGIGQVMGGLILIGMGSLQLGLTDQPLRVILGLLTVFAGFEIFYAAVETSTLVSGLLAIVNLGLALAGAYLIVVPERERLE
jgi:hypothetical protein